MWFSSKKFTLLRRTSSSLKDVEMSLLRFVGIMLKFQYELARSGAKNHCKSAPLQPLRS